MQVHNVFEVYCSDTENCRTEIFARLIFSSSEVFFFIGKSHKGQDLANKEGAESRQPFPVSDIRVQWPLCVTKHCRATTTETSCWSTA